MRSERTGSRQLPVRCVERSLRTRAVCTDTGRFTAGTSLTSARIAQGKICGFSVTPFPANIFKKRRLIVEKPSFSFSLINLEMPFSRNVLFLPFNLTWIGRLHRRGSKLTFSSQGSSVFQHSRFRPKDDSYFRPKDEKFSSAYLYFTLVQEWFSVFPQNQNVFATHSHKMRQLKKSIGSRCLFIFCSSQAVHSAIQHEATHQNAQVTNPPSSHKTWFDFVWSGLKACHTESRPLNTSRTTPRSLRSTPTSSTKSEVLEEVIQRNYDSVLLIWCLLGKRHFLKRGKRCCPCTKKLAAKSFDVASWCWFSKKALKWPKYVKTLLRECIIPPNPGTELDFKEIFSQFGRF